MPRAKRRPGPTFTGELNNPIDTEIDPRPRLGLSVNENLALFRKHNLKLLVARLEKLELLANHYSIDLKKGASVCLHSSLLLILFPAFWMHMKHRAGADGPNRGRH
jgi:hypothetical protein